MNIPEAAGEDWLQTVWQLADCSHKVTTVWGLSVQWRGLMSRANIHRLTKRSCSSPVYSPTVCVRFAVRACVSGILQVGASVCVKLRPAKAAAAMTRLLSSSSAPMPVTAAVIDTHITVMCAAI